MKESREATGGRPDVTPLLFDGLALFLGHGGHVAGGISSTQVKRAESKESLITSPLLALAEEVCIIEALAGSCMLIIGI